MTEDDVRAQQALADVIRERAGLVGRSQASIYRAVGVSSSAWQNYFKSLDREVPLWVVRATAHELGLTAGQLVARAELREAEIAAPPTAQERADAYRAGMSPEARAALDEAHPRPERDGDESHETG